MTEFVKQYLPCMDSKAGQKVPRLSGETVHRTRPDKRLNFDYLYVRDSGPLGKDNDGLDAGDGFKYILVLMDDSSNVLWCTAVSTANHLLRWCKALG